MHVYAAYNGKQYIGATKARGYTHAASIILTPTVIAMLRQPVGHVCIRKLVLPTTGIALNPF